MVNGLESKGMNLSKQEGTTLFRALRVGDGKQINRESAYNVIVNWKFLK